MNKSEIQSRIEKCESDLAALKADLAQAEFAKCDCEDKAQAGGIEQEKCWHAVTEDGRVVDWHARTKQNVRTADHERPAYMPECRQVTNSDAITAASEYFKTSDYEELARKLHKLGFRMKVMVS